MARKFLYQTLEIVHMKPLKFFFTDVEMEPNEMDLDDDVMIRVPRAVRNRWFKTFSKVPDYDRYLF